VAAGTLVLLDGKLGGGEARETGKRLADVALRSRGGEPEVGEGADRLARSVSERGGRGR
jgi:hypothetical protein